MTAPFVSLAGIVVGFVAMKKDPRPEIGTRLVIASFCLLIISLVF